MSPLSSLNARPVGERDVSAPRGRAGEYRQVALVGRAQLGTHSGHLEDRKRVGLEGLFVLACGGWMGRNGGFWTPCRIFR